MFARFQAIELRALALFREEVMRNVEEEGASAESVAATPVPIHNDLGGSDSIDDVARCAATHALDEGQTKALAEMVAALSVPPSSSPSLLDLARRWACGPHETPTFMCQRFLRARRFNVEAALTRTA